MSLVFYVMLRNESSLAKGRPSVLTREKCSGKELILKRRRKEKTDRRFHSSKKLRDSKLFRKDSHPEDITHYQTSMKEISSSLSFHSIFIILITWFFLGFFFIILITWFLSDHLHSISLFLLAHVLQVPKMSHKGIQSSLLGLLNNNCGQDDSLVSQNNTFSQCSRYEP